MDGRGRSAPAALPFEFDVHARALITERKQPGEALEVLEDARRRARRRAFGRAGQELARGRRSVEATVLVREKIVAAY